MFERRGQLFDRSVQVETSCMRQMFERRDLPIHGQFDQVQSFEPDQKLCLPKMKPRN